VCAAGEKKNHVFAVVSENNNYLSYSNWQWLWRKNIIMSYVLEKIASCKQLKKSTGSSNTTIEIKTT
jgi:hypothetical protein